MSVLFIFCVAGAARAGVMPGRVLALTHLACSLSAVMVLPRFNWLISQIPDLQSCLLAIFLGSYFRYPLCSHVTPQHFLVHISDIPPAVMSPRNISWFIFQISSLQSYLLAKFLGSYFRYPPCSHAGPLYFMTHISVFSLAVI